MIDRNDGFYQPKYSVFKTDDVINYLGELSVQGSYQTVDTILTFLNTVDKKDNDYIVINEDEPYAEQVYDIMKTYYQQSKEIVAFIGRAGSGKDYQCNILKKHGFKHVAFADALRDIAFTCLGINYEWGMKHYDELKKTNIRNLSNIPSDSNECERDFTFRDVLEQLGTEGIRKYDDDFWCKCLIKTLEENNYNKICISDMRFINEYKYLCKYAKENDYYFKVIFCDYRSNRYQEHNTHPSAIMGNYFATHGYYDLQEITQQDMERYQEYLNLRKLPV